MTNAAVARRGPRGAFVVEALEGSDEIRPIHRQTTCLPERDFPMFHFDSLRFSAASILSVLAATACSSVEGGAGSEPTDVGSGTQTAAVQGAAENRHGADVADVVLVHGAWADGSSWLSVIPLLQDEGFTVHAVQLREQSLADDAALVRHAIGGISGPVVVAGHSYGGLVISEATAAASNVTALVFVAAFAPDVGESVGSVSAGYPSTPAISHLVVDDQGNATIDPDAFVQYFASDLPVKQARALAAVQHPIAVGVFGTSAGTPGWRSIRSYYQVSANDEVIDPALERMFAKRMHAETIELRSSHVSMISHARSIADLIERAASGH
jgi:pimeloyl-ACP methyl ester carboxylesterase